MHLSEDPADGIHLPGLESGLGSHGVPYKIHFHGIEIGFAGLPVLIEFGVFDVGAVLIAIKFEGAGPDGVPALIVSALLFKSIL